MEEKRTEDSPAGDEMDVTVVLENKEKSEAFFPESGALPENRDPSFAERFQFICAFASGGVGEVSKAKDTLFDRVVAVKTLNAKFRDDPGAVRAFIEECRLNARLDHPSIVPVYAMAQGEDGYWQVAMKLINGSSLNSFIVKLRASYDGRTVTPREVHLALASRLEYFLKICEVIDYCHSRGIVHGDIKPENILLGQYGEVYVMDWGCARLAGSVPERLNGTPNYLPPEFLRTRVVTPQVDVYSLGMVLFEMVTLRRGVSDGSEVGNLSRCNISEVGHCRHYLPEVKISRAARAIIARAVHPDPAQRYGSVRELADDVRHLIYDEEVSAAPDNPVQKLFRMIYHNRIKTILIVGTLFLALCGWLFLVYDHANRLEQERSVNLTHRLQLQSYTDDLAAAVAHNFVLVQAQLLLFADNLIEDMQEPVEQDSRFYDNSASRSPETSPPGMIRAASYSYPINLDYMVRIPADPPNGVRLRPLGAKQFVNICSKILSYDLSSHDINENRGGKRLLLKQGTMIQRLLVQWANNVRYSYPGSYENPASPATIELWKQIGDTGRDRKIIWSAPYAGNIGKYRIYCRYPLYTPAGEFLGTAGFELRFERILQPLLRANTVDPAHELYFVDSHRSVVTVQDRKFAAAAPGEPLPGPLSADEVLELADRLQENQLLQFETEIGGKTYFVSGDSVNLVNGLLIQLIECETMANHVHKE